MDPGTVTVRSALRGTAARAARGYPAISRCSSSVSGFRDRVPLPFHEVPYVRACLALAEAGAFGELRLSGWCTREALLGMLTDQTDQFTDRIGGRVIQLNPTAEDKRDAREALLGMLTDADASGFLAEALLGDVIQLDPTGPREPAQQRRRMA